MLIRLSLILTMMLSQMAWSQVAADGLEEIEDDMNLGGDIFSDFNEELEASQVLEDERFYRYGRFFSANFGLGVTGFTGNRGAAYINNPPTYHLSVVYFFNFQVAFTMGLEFSKHTMYIDTIVNAHKDTILGAVDTSMLRTFFGMKYYIDTTDLGTALTYSNPYFVGRFEYWYQTNTFTDRPEINPQSKGAVGTGLGMGLEFPIEVKSSYVGVEFLWHQVNFFDKYTQDYRAIPGSEYGYDDLSGNVYSAIVTYNVTW